MIQDYDFEEDFISERIPDLEQLLTQRSRETKHKLSGCHTSRPDYSSVNIRKILQSERSSTKDKKDFNSVLLRSIKFEQHKDEKIKNITQQNDKNLMKQCTFKPKVNRSFGDKKRSMKEFLLSQQEFVKKVDAKKDQIKKRLRNSIDQSIKPKNHRKNISSTITATQSVYDRLYKKSKENFPYDQYRTKQSFTPLISQRSKNINREVPISQHLYTDALRRKQDQINRESFQYSSVIEPPKQLSMKTQMYASQKFIKQFYYAVQHLGISQPLQFQSFVKILQILGFITLSVQQIFLEHSQNKQTLLIQQAYDNMSDIGLSFRNLCVLLLSLLGIHYVNPTESTDEQMLTFNPEESKKIKEHFDLLYRNRLFMQQLRKTVPSEQHVFHPQINEKSEVLAEVRRHKILQQTSGLLEKSQFSIDVNSFNHVDLLHLNKINKEISIMKRRQQNREKDMKECTFHPQTTSRGEDDPEAGIKKCDQLYQLSKMMGERKMRTKQDIEFQKNKGQCTFKPVINKENKKTFTLPAKNFQKTIVRMHEARKIKQEKDRKLGIIAVPDKHKTSKSANSSHTQSLQQQQPFLVIDINIGSSIQQLVIYRKDLGNQERLSHEFASKHKIDPAGQQRLTQLLRQQINVILQKISEQDQEQEASSLQ